MNWMRLLDLIKCFSFMFGFLEFFSMKEQVKSGRPAWMARVGQLLNKMP